MLKGITARKFREWTEGLSPEESRKNVFNKIRDIRYLIDPGSFGVKKGPEGMLRSGYGTCFPKHYLLGAMLEGLGLETEYLVYSFYWKDQSPAMPVKLRQLAARVPATYHLACSVLIGGDRILLDATWDRPLGREGFPVNADWDGESSCILAVAPRGEARRSAAADDADRTISESFAAYSPSEKIGLSRFSIEFNRWVEEIRAAGKD